MLNPSLIAIPNLTPQSSLGELPMIEFQVSIKIMGEAVTDAFKKHKQLPGVVVVEEDGALIGMISRQRFLELISKPFRQELYQKKPIRILMKYGFNTPLTLAASMPIAQATSLALERDSELLYEPIVVTLPGHPYRLLDTHILLHSMARIAELQFEELRHTQGILIQSEKLASLGGLVAGVAHEINTPIGIGLTAVTHFVEKLEKFRSLYASDKMSKKDLQKFLDVAGESGQLVYNNLMRAADLVQSFKQVAVDQTSEKPRAFNLAGTIHDILQSLRPKYKNSEVKILVDCPEEIELDSLPGPFSQVLTNLIINALIHGFRDNRAGNITIVAKSVGKNLVEISVADDGCGIPNENINKIFEPFFTTRRGSGGSGLGLHIVYTLVTARLGGSIECLSVVNQGTKFIIRLARVLHIPKTSKQCN